MNHLHLLIPDLFPPQNIAAEVCVDLHLPVLEKVLVRGSASTSAAISLEDWLCASFGVHAVAPVRASAYGLDTGDGYWLCADPVNLQLHRAQMMLIPEVAATQEEAAALCDKLNAHFAGQGMQFFATHPLRWHLRLEAGPQLSTTPLRQAAWQDAKFHQPLGADTLHWQRILTEIQMVLYAHPLNQAREARGELLVSSLWLWGGGRAVSLHSAFDAVGGDSDTARAFARAAGITQAASLEDMLHAKGAGGLWVNEAMSSAQQRGDYHAWREAVFQLELDCVLLLQALRTGRLQQLTLEVSGANCVQRFELTRASVWKLWQPVRALARYAV
ncbi:MAG: hypothetical protein HY799_04715 [Nitrosomonadales bacterium]|nr:hypothetical protein [Nitrosomonadales bacterium]